MFYPKYTITNSILESITFSEVAKEIISSFEIVPGWEAKLQSEAKTKFVYHTSHLEGNPLTQDQVTELLEGREVIAKDSDTQDIKNCLNCLKFIDIIRKQVGQGRSYLFTLETILEMHRLATYRILSPEKAGVFRESQIVVKNSTTGEVTYTPPPSAEVSYLMEDLINWINSKPAKSMHPIIKAAIVHYEIGRIHPFVDANGRVARLISLLLLYLDGFELKRLYSYDKYFDDDPMHYYSMLQEISNQKVLDNHQRDLTSWIEYCALAMSRELTRIKEVVRRVSTEGKVKDKLGDEVELNERQMMLIEWLHKNKEMANRDFRKIFPDLSDDTVLREMKLLKTKGIIKKVGGTKKARYVLSQKI